MKHPFKIALILMAFYSAGAIQFFALQPGTAVCTSISVIAGLSASAVAFFLTKEDQREKNIREFLEMRDRKRKEMADEMSVLHFRNGDIAQKQQDAEDEHMVSQKFRIN